MTEITGVVEAKKKDGKAIKVDGVWHSAYNAAALSTVNDGDTVTFTSTPSSDGRWNNIRGKVLVQGAVAVAGVPIKPESTSRLHHLPVPLDRDRCIIRQNALTNARELVTNFYRPDIEGYIKDFDEVVAVTISVARQFEEYTSGDGDMEVAKRKLEEMEVN